MSTTIKERSKRRKKAMEQQLALISEKSPDAFAWLEAKCSAHIDEKIKPEQMATAKKRLQWELKMIQEHRLAVIFLHLHQYMEMAGITAEEVLHRGFLPCSVVAYLLGLTSFNPITYGLPTELFYGKYKNGSFVYELPSLEFAVSYTTRERSFDILRRLPGVGDAVELGWEHQLWIAFLPQENAPEIGPVFHKDNGSTCAVFYQEAKEKCWYWGISTDQHLEHLSLLYQRTGVRPENIDPGDQGVLDYLRNGTVSPREVLCPADLRLETLGLGIVTPKFEELVSLLNPASFNDFVKITGLLYCSGAWTEKIQSMVKTGELTIKNIFATREDIKEYLVGKGIPSEKVSNMPRWPKDMERLNAELQKAAADEWCRKSCKEITSLFPRANVLSRTAMYWRLAYFRCYYPDIFYETLFRSSRIPSCSYSYGVYETG